MGGKGSQEAKDGTNPQQQQQANDDKERIKEQRAKFFQKQFEQKQRDEALKNQQVIDFKDQGVSEESKQEIIKPEVKPEVKPIPETEKVKVKAVEVIQPKVEEKKSILLTQSVQVNKPQPKQETTPVKQAVVKPPPVTKEQRIHTFLSDVFQISNSSQAADKSKTFLYEYCGDDKLFKMDDLADIIMSRLHKDKDENKFIYLFKAFRRVEGHLYVKEKIIENSKEILEMIASYFITCLQCPESFDLTNNVVTQLDYDPQLGSNGGNMFMAMMGGGAMPGLGESLSSELKFTFTSMQNFLWDAFERESFSTHSDFMKLLVAQIADDEEQQELLFGTLFDKMYLNMNNINVEKFRQADGYLGLTMGLFEFKETQDAFVKSHLFYRAGLTGRQIQQATYLGRYLSYSCLFTETQSFKQQSFKGLSKMNPSQQQRAMEQVAEQFFRFHSLLHDVINKLLKNPIGKEKVLHWLRAAVSLNFEKMKMQSNKPVASDGFIYNLIDVLLLFCKPFTSKFGQFYLHFPKINCFYLANDTYIQGASKLEKINQDLVTMFLTLSDPNTRFSGVTQEASEESSLTQEGGATQSNKLFSIPAPNFITECFFQTHVLINFMAEKVGKYYEHLARELNKTIAAKDMNTYEDIRGNLLTLEAQVAGKNTLENYRSLLTFSGSLYMAMANYSNRSHLVKEAFESVEAFSQAILALPIEKGNALPADLACFPLCILSNLGQMPKLFRMFQAESYYGKDTDLHIQLATTVSVILNKNIRNPHIRVEMIDFVSFLAPKTNKKAGQKHNAQRDREEMLYKDVFFHNYAFKQHLMEALITVYIDSERTTYYQKFNYRYQTSLIMEYIWSDQNYRDKFLQLGQERPGFFIEFCNFLINDMNNLLFDGLICLEEIKNYETLKNSPEDWNQIDNEQKQQLTAQYEEHQKKSKGMLQLSNMVIQLLAKVTMNVKEPFISEELGEKFANAINFCLDSLVGQKGLKLKVNNPEQYNFEPVGLLVNIISMYGNMSDQEVFLVNVMNDTRSFKLETFLKAIRTISKPNSKIQVAQEQLEAFQYLTKSLQSMELNQEDEEIFYENAPEEYLDPVMSTLMKDPVELPSSKTIIDYITIKKHLMNDPNDPFNRSPLTLEQVIPRPDIKQQIEEYKELRRKQHQQKQMKKEQDRQEEEEKSSEVQN